MKIERIELRHIVLELPQPFITSFGTTTERHLIILKVFSDIGVCFAESSPREEPDYSYETIQTVLHVLEDFIAPIILNRVIRTIEELHSLLKKIRGHHMAKSGVETAFYHLLSAREGKSLAQYLGGTRTAINVGISLGIPSRVGGKSAHEELLGKVGSALEKQYKRIKIKIKPGWDLEPVRIIRERFGEIPLMVDANSAYSLQDADIFKEMDQYNLLMIEQPLAEDDIYEHSLLQKRIRTPICLDESIESVTDARLAVEIGACQIINIKLCRVGGIYPSIQIHDLCQERGIPVWSGGVFESGIGKADSTALCTLPNFKLPADIAPSDRYFIRDIVSTSLVLEDGQIKVPTAPGVGIDVDERVLEKVTVLPLKILK